MGTTKHKLSIMKALHNRPPVHGHILPKSKHDMSHNSYRDPPANERPKSAKNSSGSSNNKSPPAPPSAEDAKSKKETAASSLADLPSLGSKKQKVMPKEDFDDFGFIDEEEE